MFPVTYMNRKLFAFVGRKKAPELRQRRETGACFLLFGHFGTIGRDRRCQFNANPITEGREALAFRCPLTPVG